MAQLTKCSVIAGLHPVCQQADRESRRLDLGRDREPREAPESLQGPGRLASRLMLVLS